MCSNTKNKINSLFPIKHQRHSAILLFNYIYVYYVLQLSRYDEVFLSTNDKDQICSNKQL